MSKLASSAAAWAAPARLEFELVHVAQHVEERGERGGGVEVVRERGVETVLPLFQRRGQFRRIGFRAGFFQPDPEIFQPADGVLRGLDAFEGEVERLAVVRADEDVAHGHRVAALLQQVAQGEEVPERLGHLLPVDEQEPRVHPVLDPRDFAGGAFGLRDLGFVVREDVVLGAGVDVELVAEVLAGHGGALDVPAGKAAAPRAVPLHDVFRVLLPEREVGRMALLGIDLDARAGLELLDRVAAQPAVAREGGDVVIDVAVDDVGVPVRAMRRSMSAIISGMCSVARGYLKAGWMLSVRMSSKKAFV